MAETHILIVRHPETEANINGRFVGQGESPFTELGRVQARRLPAKIARVRAGRASGPRRCCEPVSSPSAPRGSPARPLHVDARLIELDFGAAHALTWEEIAEAGIPFNYRSAEEPVAPGGESRNELQSARWRSWSTRCTPRAADTCSYATQASCAPRSLACSG